MPSSSERACSSCGHQATEPFFELADIPVLVCSFWPDPDTARACPRGDIALEHCPRCGLIENHRFDPGRVEYGEGYENSLHFSEFFEGYLKGLAEDLVETYGLAGKRVAEIGCGDGAFLELLCALGAREGIGFDPSYPADRPELLADGRARVVRDYFRAAPGGLPADLVVCRQVLEHVPEPRRFLEEVRAALEPDARPAVLFEVPNTLYTLGQVSLWDVIYEHRTYFTRGSLARLFAAAGFEVTGAFETYAEQFVAVAARPCAGDAPGAIRPAVDPPEEVAAAVGRFASASRERVESWRDRLREHRAAGRRVVLWGAGARGVNFLNVADLEGVVERAVDKNPRKHGLFVAGTGQRVDPPEALADAAPDVVVVTNPNYIEEIRSDLAKMGLRPDVQLA